MEPVTDKSDIAVNGITESTETGTSSKKQTRSPERVTLGSREASRVDSWVKQIHESSRGFLCLSRSDVVNFLVREHREELAPNELKRIRSDHYDPIRHMQWIMPQIKEAWSKTDHARVAELQEELRTVELSTSQGSGDAAPASNERPSSRQKRSRKLNQAEATRDLGSATTSTLELGVSYQKSPK